MKETGIEHSGRGRAVLRLAEFPIEDIGFYEARIPSPQARILELGCGTGRVLIPLAHRCAFIHGVDSSEAMLALCAEKVSRAGLDPANVELTQSDITTLQVPGLFDLIIAPFRVMQNLETDAQLTGLLSGIRERLAPGGSAILNAFRPNRSPAEMCATWCVAEEQVDFEKELPEGGRLVRTHRRPRLQSEPLVCFPEILYRQYAASGALLDEAILKIAMRCWYPDELEKLVTDHGFHILNRWGGYAGETWGEGPELVLQFG